MVPTEVFSLVWTSSKESEEGQMDTWIINIGYILLGTFVWLFCCYTSHGCQEFPWYCQVTKLTTSLRKKELEGLPVLPLMNAGSSTGDIPVIRLWWLCVDSATLWCFEGGGEILFSEVPHFSAVNSSKAMTSLASGRHRWKKSDMLLIKIGTSLCSERVGGSYSK